MELKHTPGPWIIKTHKTSIGNCFRVHPDHEKYREHGGACLYNDQTSLNPHSDGEQKANARLIAVSPEMLEHLKDFYKLCLSLKILKPTEKLIDTIEKATGQKIEEILK